MQIVKYGISKFCGRFADKLRAQNTLLGDQRVMNNKSNLHSTPYTQ